MSRVESEQWLSAGCVIKGVLIDCLIAGFIDMPELLTHMHFNYQEWKQYEQQGINTLEDVKAKQKSLAETTSH